VDLARLTAESGITAVRVWFATISADTHAGRATPPITKSIAAHTINVTAFLLLDKLVMVFSCPDWFF
jgi:hypothetical protein